MKIELDSVSKGAALPPTSASFRSGEVAFARAETEQRPTVLGLVASGRMKPDSGTVTIDGEDDAAAIRRRVALIDAPTVSEPMADITVAGIAAEELMFAGHWSNPKAVRKVLDGLGMSEYARAGIGTIPPSLRIRFLAELALMRTEVDGIVLVSPDRHGGDPLEWWRISQEIAARGIAVLAIAGDAAAAAIGASGLIERMQTTEAAVEAPIPEPVHEPEQTFDEDPGLDETDRDLATDLDLDIPLDFETTLSTSKDRA